MSSVYFLACPVSVTSWGEVGIGHDLGLISVRIGDSSEKSVGAGNCQKIENKRKEQFLSCGVDIGKD